MKQQSLYRFRDWFFDLLIDYFVNSGWIIVIRDFKKSEKRSERNILGQTDYKNEIIYLDKDCGTRGARGAPRILVHEIGHFALGIILEKMALNMSWKDLKRIKGKSLMHKKFRWEELRVIEFEKLFYHSLNETQIRILQDFIDEARARYKEEEG